MYLLKESIYGLTDFLFFIYFLLISAFIFISFLIFSLGLYYYYVFTISLHKYTHTWIFKYFRSTLQKHIYVFSTDLYTRSHISKRYLHNYFHCNIIQNSQDIEKLKSSLMDELKKYVIYRHKYNGILFSHTK